MLNQMVDHVDFNHPIQVAAWVAVVLGFHLLLRKSNLVPITALEFSPLHQLVCKDIHFHRGLILVNIRWSKSFQIGNRVTIPLLKSKSLACPVTALKKLFLAVQAHPQHPLFAFQHTKPYSCSRLSVLTYPSLMLYLRKWFKLVGYQPFCNSCHSLRHSGALHAFSRNMPAVLMKEMGDWHSECYQQYLEDDLALCLSAVGGQCFNYISHYSTFA